jgi:two-component system, OmpR family, sensor kinase
MHSIRRTLLTWIFGVLLLGSVLVALVTHVVTRKEMDEVFDASLRNVAEAVATYHQARQWQPDSALLKLPVRTDEPRDTEIVTATWTKAGERVFSSDPRVALPFIAREGLSRNLIAGQGWIVYSAVRDTGISQAAQRVYSRREMAAESAVQVFAPMLGLMLAIGSVLVFGLRRGLQPLNTTAQDIARRTAQSLEAIAAEGAPREIVPLVESINGLMARLAQAFSAQRQFLANAAHELRTPITALRLQLQWLQRAADEADRQHAMAELAGGIDRSQRLVEQLLQVARSEPDGETTRCDTLDLAELVRLRVATFVIKAEHAQLDLGAEAARPVPMTGDPAQLAVLLDNLIENALRYTPAGGVVDVSADLIAGQAVLCVRDNGPGIPEAERARVFDRFYRGRSAHAQARDGSGSGSGLGLAIVKAIADRHGAQIELCEPAVGTGLEVRVRFASPLNH